MFVRSFARHICGHFYRFFFSTKLSLKISGIIEKVEQGRGRWRIPLENEFCSTRFVQRQDLTFCDTLFFIISPFYCFVDVFSLYFPSLYLHNYFALHNRNSLHKNNRAKIIDFFVKQKSKFTLIFQSTQKM